ncbi:hypothetical protein [Actinomadura napierensis]|uniref:Uncharacterized protein n=1 Tax=Actinomadura napierensis TaxID=267854 RepID=A0ABN2ZW76_9ACTN
MPTSESYLAWSEDDIVRFEHAVQLLDDLLTLLNQQVNTNPGTALCAERLICLAQRQRLRITDREDVAGILRDVPHRLLELEQQALPNQRELVAATALAGDHEHR